ncbi:MFS transporter [Pokkaliibacter sp. CJK22405]|uniref:MFS transporter n=1 Tax=Pokkaliibacter sp. CJK22405 TaxID=3384615 RepID=UPI003984F3BC
MFGSLTQLRNIVLLMTGCGVVSDSLLIAFYPQFFGNRYGMTDPVWIGSYMAGISIAVMCALPVWARLARHIETIHLLIGTQFIAGCLCLLSIWAPTANSYAALSISMFVIKASYLLMFPYLMRLETPERHSDTVAMLSVVIHMAMIFAATIGGWILEYLGPSQCIALMALGDFIQMGLSLWLLKSGRIVATAAADREQARQEQADKARAEEAASASENLTETLATDTPVTLSHTPILNPWVALIGLSVLMLIFNFSAYVSRPFFSVYWQEQSGISDTTVSGLVFAIPGMMALAGLLVNRKLGKVWQHRLGHTATNMVITAVGLLLQGSEQTALLLLGQMLYGWGLFQLIVRIEVSLFRISKPSNYARDFAITNLFQKVGALLSSFGAGVIVESIGAQMTFFAAVAGFLVALLINLFWVMIDRHHPAPQRAVTEATHAPG